MARRDYEAIQQCTSELRGMLEVDLFVGAAISVGLISRNEAQGTLKALKTSQMAAVLHILQVLEKKRKCLDLFLSALRKSVEGYLDQQHSHFQLITVLVRKKEQMQVLHCEGTTRATVTDTCHTCLPSPCMPDCTAVSPSLPRIDLKHVVTSDDMERTSEQVSDAASAEDSISISTEVGVIQ